jgi:hypothetical protein
MKRLVVRRAAEWDAARARDWYQQEAELGERFIAELRESMARLVTLSNRFPEVRPGSGAASCIVFLMPSTSRYAVKKSSSLGCSTCDALRVNWIVALNAKTLANSRLLPTTAREPGNVGQTGAYVCPHRRDKRLLP